MRPGRKLLLFRGILVVIVAAATFLSIFLSFIVFGCYRAERVWALRGAADNQGGPFFTRHGGDYVSGNSFMTAQSFPAAKSPGEFRVFVLGNSTAMGEPYTRPILEVPFAPALFLYLLPDKGGISFWLREYLKKLLPGRRITVINAALAAGDAPATVKMMREVLRIGQADLIIWGEAYERPRFHVSKGMFESVMRRLTRDYERDLSSAVALAETRKTATYFLTGPDNLRDWVPMSRPGLRGAKSPHYWWSLAKRWDRAGHFEKARGYYIQAKDLDRVWMRSRTPWNDMVRRIHGRYARPIDMERRMFAYARDGIPGFDLFHDPVHLRLRGYRDMAFEIAKRIERDMGLSRLLRIEDASMEPLITWRLKALYWIKAFRWGRVALSLPGQSKSTAINAAAVFDRFYRDGKFYDSITRELDSSFGGRAGHEAARRAAGEPPNGGRGQRPKTIILLVVDTLRADYARRRDPSSGSPLTPNLIAFSSESVAFDNAFSQASWSLPAHASLFSSRYVTSHGTEIVPGPARRNGSPIRGVSPGMLFFTEALKKNGYRTIGYFTSNAMISPEFGFDRGFDSYRNTPDRYADTGTNAATVFDAAASWLNAHAGEKKFLFINTMLVHNYLSIAPGSDQKSGFTCPYAMIPRNVREPFGPGDPSCRIDRRKYDHALSCADREIGRFFDGLKRIGQFREALIVVTGDHGEGLCAQHGGGFDFSHAGPGYEDQVHVPLLVHLPGGRMGGEALRPLVEIIDIGPTILQAAGIKAPAEFQGKSLLPLISGEAPSLHDRVFSEGGGRNGGWKMVRTPDFKYIAYARGGEELYDLRNDPAESRNIVKENPRILAKMRASLIDFMARGRLGYHLAACGGAADKFKISVESRGPISREGFFFSKDGGKVASSRDHGRLEALLHGRRGGGCAWLSFEVSSATPTGVFLKVDLNDRPMPLKSLYIGASRAGGARYPVDLAGSLWPKGKPYLSFLKELRRPAVWIWRNKGGAVTELGINQRKAMETVKRLGYWELLQSEPASVKK